MLSFSPAMVVGFPTLIVGSSTFALGGAKSGGYSPNWLAYGLRVNEAKTVSKIMVYTSAITGSPGTSDAVCDIYSDNANPNASLASSATVTAAPTANAWLEFTGFTYALTANTQYWIVIRNQAADTSTTNFTCQYPDRVQALTGMTGMGFVPIAFAGIRTSTNSGSTWSGIVNGPPQFRVEFDDSTFVGYPVATPTAIASGERAFGSTEHGVRFTTPANGQFKIAGLTLGIGKIGTPTGSLRFRLYEGSSTTPTATTESIAPANLNASLTLIPLYFSALQTLAANTVYRVTASNSAADSSANAYTSLHYLVQSSAGSRGLLPWSCQKTVLAAGAWTDTDTNILSWGLILDPTDPLVAGSAGGLITHPGMSGGMRG